MASSSNVVRHPVAYALELEEQRDRLADAAISLYEATEARGAPVGSELWAARHAVRLALQAAGFEVK